MFTLLKRFCCTVSDEFTDPEETIVTTMPTTTPTTISDLIKNINPKNIKWLGDYTGEKFFAKCFDVYDGDTISICFYDPNDIQTKIKCRLKGIDCAEIKAKPGAKKGEKTLEQKVALYTREQIQNKLLDKVIFIIGGKPDMYGRCLVEIYLSPNDKQSINEWLIQEGLAYEYKGSTKKKFEEWFDPTKCKMK